jgi:putative component of membrane protein insertase Oxa1/YidC/SpoIIIJ protein YidD
MRTLPASSLLLPIDWSLLGLVHGYRQWVSPRKGFGCPHRLLRGGRSCSEFGRDVLRRCGCLRFRELMRRRFARCRAAAEMLKVLEYESKEDRRRRRAAAKARREDRQPWCDCYPGSSPVPSCDIGPIDCGIGDGSGLADAGCGSVDCSCG